MPPDPTTEFVTLLARHDRALSLYVYGLVTRQSDADDILQQTKLILWKNFASFEPGTHFLAWARKTAFHQILSYRRKAKRDPLPLDDQMIEQLSGKVAALTEHDQSRREALESCLHRLAPDHRQLVLLRYQEDLEIDDIATRLGTTAGAAYRSLSRLRLTLMDCVRQRLQTTSSLSL